MSVLERFVHHVLEAGGHFTTLEAECAALRPGLLAAAV
jgi:hypothetical protein